jgi:hypothetical protein
VAQRKKDSASSTLYADVDEGTLRYKISQNIRIMKKIQLFFIVWIGLPNYVNCQVITDLEIYYLPWSIRPDAQLSAEDVRDFNNGRNSYYCIQDSTIIAEFIHSMSIFYLRPFPELKKINHVMVIDIHFKRGGKRTVGLNTKKFLSYEGTCYSMNWELINWIDKYVPPAENPFVNKTKKKNK